MLSHLPILKSYSPQNTYNIGSLPGLVQENIHAGRWFPNQLLEFIWKSNRFDKRSTRFIVVSICMYVCWLLSVSEHSPIFKPFMVVSLVMNQKYSNILGNILHILFIRYNLSFFWSVTINYLSVFPHNENVN